MITVGNNNLFRAGITEGIISELGEVWINEGSTIQAVAAIPNHIQRVVIAQGATYPMHTSIN